MQVLKDKIRNKILAVSENMFYTKGFRNASMRDIANEVGISVSNLYLYYANKEAIFYGVTDGFFRYFINALETFLDHDDKDVKTDLAISHILKKIIISDQMKFVILTGKSQGTKYEGFTQHMVMMLNNHMMRQVKKDLVHDNLIIYILAKNFIEGIIEIAKNYKDEVWLETNINVLVNYHMRGMEYLM